MHRTVMNTRLISFAGSIVAVEYSSHPAARIVNFLFRHIPLAVPSTVPHLIHRLVFDEIKGWSLYENGTLIQQTPSEGEIAECLLGQTCHQLADRSSGGLLLHAAGLFWQGRGLILPGPTGTGKSTLTAWLLMREFHYLTDELVFIPHTTDYVQAFPRPINLKYPIPFKLPVHQEQINEPIMPSTILSTPAGALVPPQLLSSQSILRASPVDVIIFPRYCPNSEFSLTRLSKARAGLELMQCLANARNLPEHGFPEVARIVRTIPAYRLIYKDFNTVGQRIKELLSSH